MGAIQIVGGILLIVSSIILIIVIILQESKQSGLSAMTGGTDSYLSKNRSRSMDTKLASITKVLAIIFFVLALVLNILLKK